MALRVGRRQLDQLTSRDSETIIPPIRSMISPKLDKLSYPGASAVSIGRYRRILAAGLSAVMGKGTSIGVTAVIIPLVVRYLGSEGYGVWATISSTVAIFYVFDIGIAATLTNLISEAYSQDNKEDAAACFSTALWMVLGVCLIMGTAGIVVWTHVNWAAFFNVKPGMIAYEAPRAVLVAFLVFLIALPASLVVKVLGGYQEVHAANLFTSAGSLLSLILVMCVIRLRGSLPELVAVYATSIPLMHLVCLLWLILIHKPWLKPKIGLLRRRLVSKLFHSGSQFFLIQIAGIVVMNSDNIVISHFLGPSQVTPYSITWRIVSYITAVPAVFIPALWPAYSEAYTRGDLDWIRAAYRRNAWITMLVLAVGCTVILTAGKRIILFWAGPSAVPSATLLRMMCIWMVIFSITLNQSCLMGATYRTSKQAALSIVSAALNLLLSIVWVRHYGSLGVLMATIVSYVLFILAPQNLEVRGILRGDFLSAGSSPNTIGNY